MFSTVAREIPAYSAQFSTYEILKDSLVSEDHPNLTFLEGCIVGAFAGANCWIFSYPVDIVKTKIQVSSPSLYPRHKYLLDGGLISCSQSIYQ